MRRTAARCRCRQHRPTSRGRSTRLVGEKAEGLGLRPTVIRAAQVDRARQVTLRPHSLVARRTTWRGTVHRVSSLGTHVASGTSRHPWPGLRRPTQCRCELWLPGSTWSAMTFIATVSNGCDAATRTSGTSRTPTCRRRWTPRCQDSGGSPCGCSSCSARSCSPSRRWSPCVLASTPRGSRATRPGECCGFTRCCVWRHRPGARPHVTCRYAPDHRARSGARHLLVCRTGVHLLLHRSGRGLARVPIAARGQPAVYRARGLRRNASLRAALLAVGVHARRRGRPPRFCSSGSPMSRRRSRMRGRPPSSSRRSFSKPRLTPGPRAWRDDDRRTGTC